jgi:dihydroflavonol-4-reductase
LNDELPVLVTGASGHIGANLVRALLGQNRRVRALVRRHTTAVDGLPVEVVRADLRDGAAVSRACAGAGTIFHLAGKVSAGWESDAEVNAINVTGTSNVVEACLAAGVGRLVHFSSIQALAPRAPDGLTPVVKSRICVASLRCSSVKYDEYSPASRLGPLATAQFHSVPQPVRCSRPGTDILDEACDLVPSDQRGRGAYDRAKAEAERLVLGANERGLDAVVLNPTAVLGPFDFQRSPMGEVLLALGRGKLPALVAGGECDFVDVRDVVEGALAAEQRGRRGERYVLSGTRLSLVELARQWAMVTGRAAPRLAVPMGLARLAAPFAPAWARWRGQRPLFTTESLRVLRMQPPASHRKAAAELGYRPRPLDETLRDTCAWMKGQGWL